MENEKDIQQKQIIINAFQLNGVTIASDLAQQAIIKTAIGINAANQKNVTKPNDDFKDLKVPIADSPATPQKSQLGTPIWTNLIFTPANYTDPITNESLDVPTGADGNSFMLTSVILTVTGNKNIIATPIQGRNSTVKEYIARNDYKINIKGGLFGGNQKRTDIANDLNRLRAIWEFNQSIQVQAPVLQEWGISSIVIEDISIPESMGGYSYQMFEINAISDTELLFDISGL